MAKNEKVLCAVYGIIAVVALVATWTNNLAFLAQPENHQTTSFFHALYLNHASASIANDLFLLCLVCFIFMVREARRLGIRHVWIYILLSMLVAISVMFSLFLIARQVAMSKQRIRQARDCDV